MPQRVKIQTLAKQAESGQMKQVGGNDEERISIILYNAVF
jgi:hypothetical protein